MRNNRIRRGRGLHTDAEQQYQESPRSTDAEQQYQESPRYTDAVSSDAVGFSFKMFLRAVFHRVASGGSWGCDWACCSASVDLGPS